MDKDRLFELASELDSALQDMNMVASSMQILDEHFDSEGFQYDENFNETMAIQFVKRFPLLYDMFKLVRINMCEAMEKMEEINKKMSEGAGE